MKEHTLRERRVRVRKMNRVLRTLFPQTRIHLNHSTPWELLVAVILSAQCTDARVNQVTPALFSRYTTIRDYAYARRTDLERLVFQTGFYKSKARYIHTAARSILERHNGVVPDTMEELILLPGVGRKTANVVLSTAFGKASGIAVDTHVRRFAIRFDLTDFDDPERIERDLMRIMPKGEWWGFNHRLVEYGRKYCPARKHACEEHPLSLVYKPACDRWPRAHRQSTSSRVVKKRVGVQ